MTIDKATCLTLLHLKEFLTPLVVQGKVENYSHLPPTQTPSHLLWMIETVLENPSWPIDKKSRWLGFIQGVCCCHFGMDVDKERDFTRPLFHKAYYQDEQDLPQTLENPMACPPFTGSKNLP